MQKQLEIAREALKFYANKTFLNEYDGSGGSSGTITWEKVIDYGEKAKEALEKIDELKGLKNETKQKMVVVINLLFRKAFIK